MTCALCLKNSKLCKSHIIPEFVYLPLYDKDFHRFHMLSNVGVQTETLPQKGLREYLLCSACEQKLSPYERYVKEMFTGKIATNCQRDGNLLSISGIDYAKFRLFGLSILWRASVAASEFFQPVNLGPHEDDIRKMVLNEDPGEPYQYGFLISALSIDVKHADSLDVNGLILQPTPSRCNQHRCYRFVFAGLIWIFIVSNHHTSSNANALFINKEGTMVMEVLELRDVPFIVRGFESVSELLD